MMTMILDVVEIVYLLCTFTWSSLQNIADDVFTKDIINALEVIFSNVCKDFESTLVEFDGEDDHVHLLVNYPPKVSISKLVNSLKGVSSHLIRKMDFPSIQKNLWGAALWSPSYFAGSCGGASIDIVRQYIEQQKTPH